MGFRQAQAVPKVQITLLWIRESCLYPQNRPRIYQLSGRRWTKSTESRWRHDSIVPTCFWTVAGPPDPTCRESIATEDQYALMVTCPFTNFFMLKPTVGIESSLNSPAARTLRSVVFPLFWSPIKVILSTSAYPYRNIGRQMYLHFRPPEKGPEPVNKDRPPIPDAHVVVEPRTREPSFVWLECQSLKFL